MNNEKILYLNEIIDGKPYSGPKYLYKYRNFDKFTFDMLKNNYVYLCPANREDDPKECDVSLDIDNIIDLKTNDLYSLCIINILNFIKPFASSDIYNKLVHEIKKYSNNGRIKSNFLLDMANSLGEDDLSLDVPLLINFLRSLDNCIDDISVKSKISDLILLAIDAKNSINICSLSEFNNIEKMWEEYANNGAGYCIEYDVSSYKYNNDIFPVIYDNDRKNNLVIQIVNNLLGVLLNKITENNFNVDESQYIRMFLTKDEKWQYQKEWRLLNVKNNKLESPKVTKIILGKNVSNDDKDKMTSYCNKNNICLICL